MTPSDRRVRYLGRAPDNEVLVEEDGNTGADNPRAGEGKAAIGRRSAFR